MSEICEECERDKICKHEYHDVTGRTNIFDSDNECPACGQPAGSPGKCSAYGDTGEEGDDNEDSDEE